MRKSMSILFVLALILVGAASSVTGQSEGQSLEEWEAKTFEKQPPEKVMDAAGVEPGMVVGEVGAGKGRFTVHLARRVGPAGRILANDIDLTRGRGLALTLGPYAVPWLTPS